MQQLELQWNLFVDKYKHCSTTTAHNWWTSSSSLSSLWNTVYKFVSNPIGGFLFLPQTIQQTSRCFLQTKQSIYIATQWNSSDGSYPNIISTEAKICKKGKTFSHIYFSYNIISRNHKSEQCVDVSAVKTRDLNKKGCRCTKDWFSSVHEDKGLEKESP